MGATSLVVINDGRNDPLVSRKVVNNRREELPVQYESQSDGEGSDGVGCGQTQTEVHGGCQGSAHPFGGYDDEYVDEES